MIRRPPRSTLFPYTTLFRSRRMKSFVEIFLGILTAMGGFVEVGELVFSVNAGAKFGYHLLWVSLIGTVGIIAYCEMAGRVAAVTEQPVFNLIRDRKRTRLNSSHPVIS